MLGFALADSLLTLFPVMTLFGFSNSLFSPASNAMIADLVGEEKRPRAYSFLRVSNNLGVAIGPAVGGFLAAISYLYSFSGAATASAIYFVIVLTLMRETLPALNPRPVVGSVIKARGGYEQVIRDVPFVVALALFILVQFTIAQMFTTLPVYMRNVYSLAEDKFGWVMTTNAAMVVLLQFWITRRVERWARLVVLALGALFYAIGVGAVALSSTFPAFILDMVIITIGEMLLFPAISALTADYAPEHLRGRYMGLFAIASGVGFGLGPVIGGAIFDQISPHSVWPLMALFGFTAALGYLVAARLFPPRAHVEAATP
jgi:MFS family permease